MRGMRRTPTPLSVWLVGVFAVTVSGASFTNEFSPYVACDWSTEDGLPSDTINAVIQAQDGYLWLATRDGLVRFDGVPLVRVEPRHFPGLTKHSFAAPCAGRDGPLWVASEAAQVRRLRNGAAFELLLPAPVTNGPVTKVFESAGDSLWIGSEINEPLGFVRVSAEPTP